MKQIATYLPVFTGFYNTIFDESDSFIESELQDEESFRSHYPDLDHIPWPFIQENFWDCIDGRSGEIGVVTQLVDNIARFYQDECNAPFILGARYERMNSPREYNFANDSVDCVIDVDLDGLKRYLKENEDDFADFLRRRYTSCDGFMSHYPNTVEEWREDTEDFNELDGHYLGSILDFIADRELDDPVMDLYYYAEPHEAYYNSIEIKTQSLIDNWRAEDLYDKVAAFIEEHWVHKLGWDEMWCYVIASERLDPKGPDLSKEKRLYLITEDDLKDCGPLSRVTSRYDEPVLKRMLKEINEEIDNSHVGNLV